MADAGAGAAGGEESSLGDLAGTLAGIARSLTKSLSTVTEDEVKEQLAASLGSIRSVSTSLRSIDLVFDPEHARHFARHGRGLHDLVGSTASVVGQLTSASQRVSAGMDEHVRELESIAKLPPGADVSARLKAAASSARVLTKQMTETYAQITTRAKTMSEGISALEGELREAREKAFIDALTKVHSRGALDARLDTAIENGDADGPWHFLRVSVDRFQRVIEDHGQIVGDALLYKVARTTEDRLPDDERRSFLARYGGEDFALILAGGDRDEVLAIADAVRTTVAAARWARRDEADQGVVQTTVSVGLTQYEQDDTVDTLLDRANSALLKARSEGGDKIVAG